MLRFNSGRAFKSLRVAVTALLVGCTGTAEVGNSVSIVTNAYWLAYQDGPTGAWTPVIQGNALGKPYSPAFRITDPEHRYGLAVVCQARDGTDVHRVDIFFATTDEVWRLTDNCPAAPGKPTTISGNLLGVDVSQGHAVLVAMSEDDTFVNFAAYARRIMSGKRDILAYTGPMEVVLAPTMETRIVPQRVAIYRDVSVAETGAANVSLNFASAAAFTVTPAVTFTLNGTAAAGETRRARVGFVSHARNYLLLAEAGENDAAMSFTGVPWYAANDIARTTPLQKDDEGHEAVLETLDGQGRRTRAAYYLVKEPEAASLVLPQPGAAELAGILIDHTQASWPLLTDTANGAANLYKWELDGVSTDSAMAAGTHWAWTVSPGWLGESASTYQLPLPNFVAVSGWTQGWSHDVTQPANWTFHAYLSRDAGAMSILDFLLHRDLLEDRVGFAEVVQRGTL